MSKFTDALNRPLPSKLNQNDVMVESNNDEGFDAEAVLESIELECFSESFDLDDDNCIGGSCDDDDDFNEDDLDDISDSDDGFDPDDMSDEELERLDSELSRDALDNIVDNEREVDLTPEEEINADDMMSIAATTLLVNDELNAEEKAQFVESEGQIAVNEGFMTSTDVNSIAMESGLVQEAKYTNKMIIRLDAESKKKQLYALAVNVSAAAHNDPDYHKLKKVMKMRKILRAKLERKYHGEATKRMKVYFNRLRRSKSNSLSKIGDKYSK